MEHPEIITYKKTMGEVVWGNLTPLAKSINTKTFGVASKNMFRA